MTVTKHKILKLIHRQPATLYYELFGPNQFITNHREHLNTKDIYLFSTHGLLNSKISTYILKIYMANSPRLSEIKEITDNSHLSLINMTIFYTPTMTVSIGEKYNHNN